MRFKAEIGATLVGTALLLPGCTDPYCYPRATAFEQTLEAGEDVIAIRVSNERMVENDTLGWYDVDGVVRNSSDSTPCQVAVYAFDQVPTPTSVAPLPLDQTDYPDDPLEGGRVIGRSLLPPRQGERTYAMDFRETVAEGAPFTSWIVVTGCADAPIQVDFEAEAGGCPERADPDDYRVDLSREF